MALENEIRQYFADNHVNSAFRLSGLDDRYPAWVVRYSEAFGVAIPYGGADINEDFANATLHNGILPLGEYGDIPCLFLLSTVESTRNEFASFCRDFVDPGERGKSRTDLLSDPVGWWKRWKQLIGNAIMEKKPYTVLGEMMMYEYLLRTGQNARWAGPGASSHDIVCPEAEYEVKSTISRYEKSIHVTGQFQLQKAAGRLYLFFCRFENSVNGVSIDDAVEKLVSQHGVDREELEAKLNGLGYALGNSARREKYQLHEVMRYEVNDDFPRITPELFKCGSIPVGIKQLSYDVDLSVVAGKSVDYLSGSHICI